MTPTKEALQHRLKNLEADLYLLPLSDDYCYTNGKLAALELQIANTKALLKSFD